MVAMDVGASPPAEPKLGSTGKQPAPRKKILVRKVKPQRLQYAAEQLSRAEPEPEPEPNYPNQVKRQRNKWSCELTAGVATIDGLDYLFTKCDANFLFN